MFLRVFIISLILGSSFMLPIQAQTPEQQRIIELVKPQLIEIIKRIDIQLSQTGACSFELQDKNYNKEKKTFSLPFMILCLSIERYYKKERNMRVEVKKVKEDTLLFNIRDINTIFS